jgi:hypothetical protein
MLNKININPGSQKLIVYIVLTVVTLAVFWQVNQFDFVNFDDDIYLTKNYHIKPGITQNGISWAFSTTYAEFWHPLTWLSLMFDYQLYGLNAGGYHLTNLILHIMSALLLFWLFNRMTGAIWKSAFVAALFALHPLRVESVAWVAERKDVLSAFFWMLTLCLYAYYTEKPVIRRYLLVGFSFVCGLMSKSMVVTLPVVMILLDYWPLKRFQSQKGSLILWQLREKIPLFIFSAIFSILSIYAQPKEPMNGWPFPLESRIINALISFVIYLEKIFWPHDLALCYPFFGQAPLWQVSGAVSLILVISVAVILMMKRLPYLFVGWLWYSVTILPVIGIIPVGNNAMADRYVYLPSIGIAIMLAWGIPLLFKGDDLRKKILFPTSAAALAILSVLSWQQCGYWKNNSTLFSRAVQVNKDSALAHGNLGLTLFIDGRIEEAIDHYNTSIRITPDYAGVYNNRGGAYAKLGRHRLAIQDFNKAIELKHDYVAAFFNRGTLYAVLGQYQLAIDDLSTAIRLKRDYVGAYNNRAFVFINQGDYISGCSDANKACELGDCKVKESSAGRELCR